jgi:hypothetical protein
VTVLSQANSTGVEVTSEQRILCAGLTPEQIVAQLKRLSDKYEPKPGDDHSHSHERGAVPQPSPISSR